MEADERPEAVINYYVKARVGIRNIANAIGFVALLWSTVVLLGGFVSILTIKDFWFLSVMSLVMASKMLEFLGTNNGGIYVAEGYILRSSKGLHCQLEGKDRPGYWIFILTLAVVNDVKIIFFFILALIFACSPFVNIGLSVARLVQRDYGDASGDAANKAKLNAALTVFYVLVILHGSYIAYWIILGVYEPWMLVSKHFGFENWGPKIVFRYRTDTNVKCQKDGLLPNNWNLITFSVGLLESASRDDHLWGARVLDTFIVKGIHIRQELLTSSQAIQNLIKMIDLTRTDDPEIRERAARIVADLGSELRIAQFPDVLRCLFCLLECCNQYSDPEFPQALENSEQNLDKIVCKEVSGETIEHSHHQEDAHLSLEITEQTDRKHPSSAELPKPNRGSWIQNINTVLPSGKAPSLTRAEWDIHFGDKYHYSYVSKGTKELISQGLVILENLTQDEDNCTEIIRYQRLLPKIISPLNYQDILSNGCDQTWFEILGRSLTVLSRLISAGPSDDTTSLRHDISRNTVAIHNLLSILEVDNEGTFSELRGQAIEILTELAFDDSFRKLAFDESTSMTEMLVKTLRRIFLEDSDDNGIVAKEGEEKDKRVRRKAGEALARLLRVPSARHNTDALTSATNLLPKQDVISLLTLVANEILSTKVLKAADVTLSGSNNSSHVVESRPPNDADTRQSSTQENDEQPEDDRKMFAAMLSLTVAICNNKNVINGDDFTGAIPDDAALVKKLKEIAETNMDATVDGWRIQKLVCQMVMAVVQLKPSCISEFNEHKFKEALSKALETMSNIDNCMIFAGDDREVPTRSLASLVKEAQKLLT